MSISGILGCLLACLFLLPTGAHTAADPRITLDTASIRKTYMEGDFDQAILDIERVLRRAYVLTHAESVFVFKHLGVMYAAKYETREKGKHYMMQLLNVEPTARILDMYASDMIYMIFKNIQNEFEDGHGRLVAENADPIRPSRKGEGGDASKRKSRAWIGWTAGLVAAAGGVALTYHLMSEAEPKENIAE